LALPKPLTQPSPLSVRSSFWALLFRPLIFPSDTNRIEDLYSTLLPYLNGRPLTDAATVSSDSHHWELPLLTHDTSRGQCTLAAVRFALTRAGLTPLAANRACLRLRCALVRMAAADLQQVCGSLNTLLTLTLALT